MRTIIWIIALSGFVLASGCAANAGMAGKWRGTISERGESTQLELNLRPVKDSVEGTLTILDNSRGDIEPGKSFDIVNARCAGGMVDFMVPVTGKLDDDALYFKLALEKGSLAGYGRELRRGSPNLGVTFTKK